MYNDLVYLKTAFESHLPLEKKQNKAKGKKKKNSTTSNLHSGVIL